MHTAVLKVGCKLLPFIAYNKFWEFSIGSNKNLLIYTFLCPHLLGIVGGKQVLVTAVSEKRLKLVNLAQCFSYYRTNIFHVSPKDASMSLSSQQ